MPRLCSICVALLSFITATTALAADVVDFLRDVRPIFVSRCYRCHSSLKQESNLRLDSGDAIAMGGDGGLIVVPSKSGESRLIQAVSRVGELKMPPEGEPLTDTQIAVLKKWIDQGARAPAGNEPVKHWSFVLPQRPALPTTSNAGWATNAIDAFVAAKHAAQKLAPVGPAPKHVLLRRVYLDLIGLPPSADEVRNFVADEAPDAYERIVDRLLAKPAYGERWGRHWMDVWRYSDWDGYGAEIRESQMHIWRWRDWIIESLNADKPYDRMIVEMLAGDELAPDDPATLRATGYLARSWYKFNRNVWLDQAIEHTGKAFLGVTFNCARCHDHMYDPLPQTDYYQLRAFFEPYDVRTDRVPGQPDGTKDGLARVFDRDLAAPSFVFIRGDEKQPNKDQPLAPALPKALGGGQLKLAPITLNPQAYYPGLRPYVHEESLAAAKADATKAEAALAAAHQNVATAKQKLTEFAAAKTTTPAAPAAEAAKPQPDVFLADDFAAAKPELWTIGAGKWEYKDGKLHQTGDSADASTIVSQKPHPRDFVAKLRFKTTGGKMWKSIGLSFDAIEDRDRSSAYMSAVAGGSKVQVSYRANGQDIYPPAAAKALPVELGKVYELQVAVREQLVNVWVDGQMQVAFRLPAARAKDGRFTFWTFDAMGEFHSLHVAALPKEMQLVENAATGQPANVATPVSTEATLTLAVTQAEAAAALAKSTLAAAQAAVVAVEARIAADRANYSSPPAEIAKELSLAAGRAERELALRQAERGLIEAQQKLDQAKAAIKPDDEKTKKAATDAEANVAKLTKARDDAQAAVAQPHENYTRFSGVHPTTSTGRRLALANWIASATNPLTARVAVNHLWLRHFGQPLVPTVFDFGMNGKPPSHPELLDWLAKEFVDLGFGDLENNGADVTKSPNQQINKSNAWSMKNVHRLMVTSATYRLSSTGRADEQANRAADPENHFLWRMNSRRMEAELVRDATLHVAGSLDRTLFGPDLDPNAGLTLTRRSVYFRSSKEKKMTFLSLFDSANPVECYRRSESVAPQQALAMANSPLTLAQARLLARSLTASTSDSKPETVTPFLLAAFEQILGRPATGDELAECEKFVAEQSQRFADPKSLTAFAAGSDCPVKPSPDPHLRARENLVHVLMNHNDFVTIR